MKYSDDFQDDATQFEPTPWGSRQRVLPRRAFKAAVSVIAQPPPPVRDEPSWFVAQSPLLRIESSSFITPIVCERDLPTWRVPKLPPPPSARRFDMRLWLPITRFAAVLVLAFLGTRSNATHISTALTADAPAITMATIEAPAVAPTPPVVAPVAAKEIAVAVVVAPTAPVVAPVAAKEIALAAPVEHAPVAKRLALAAPKQTPRTSMRASSSSSSSKRPRLDMNVVTPLGDLAKHHR